MNKKELIDKISIETKVTKRHTRKVMDKMIDIIKDELREGREVKIVGFGTYTTKTRSPHKARNPKTDEAIYVPDTKSFVKFRCSNMVTDYINKPDEE